jgi:hypothetical protein
LGDFTFRALNARTESDLDLAGAAFARASVRVQADSAEALAGGVLFGAVRKGGQGLRAAVGKGMNLPPKGKPPAWATLEPNLTRTSKESVGNLERSMINNGIPQPSPNYVGHHVIPGTVYDAVPMLKEIGFRIDYYPNGLWVEKSFHPGRHPAYTAALKKILSEIPMPTDLASRAAAAERVGKVLEATKTVLSGKNPPLRFKDAKALDPNLLHEEFTDQWETALRAAMK